MRLAILCAMSCAAFAAPAFAALPPPSDAAKAQAAEKAAKTAWTNKVAAYKLCQAQDEAVSDYHATLRQRSETPPDTPKTPDCVNPGEYTPKLPLEQSGAHSPAETATAPPSTNNTAAELDGKAKK